MIGLTAWPRVQPPRRGAKHCASVRPRGELRRQRGGVSVRLLVHPNSPLLGPRHLDGQLKPRLPPADKTSDDNTPRPHRRPCPPPGPYTSQLNQNGTGRRAASSCPSHPVFNTPA